jgi:hypothetical protein
MKPKEKALELVDKFQFILTEKQFGKQCALIAVDEVIQSYKDSWLQYWKEVKQEIELL